MNIKEAIARIHDLIHTCDVGIEKHGAYDDLFQKDKDALETVLAELEKQSKIINLMAEQLRTPVNSKEWVIDYYERKIKEDK